MSRCPGLLKMIVFYLFFKVIIWSTTGKPHSLVHLSIDRPFLDWTPVKNDETMDDVLAVKLKAREIIV